MADIGSKVTHVIQSNENGTWKNATKHEGLADAQDHMKKYIPKNKQANYRIRTIAQAGLTRNADKNKPAVKKAAVKKPTTKKVAPVAKKMTKRS
jgi:hypothetical protein